jgi:Gpi18-like mannosyltransferase
VYSESTFLFLLLLSFWFFQKEKWFLSAVSGALLSATRLVGVALLPALLYKHRKLTFFLIPLGTLLYAIYNYIKWGDPLNFIKVHGQLANSRSVDTIILFPQTLYRYSKIFLSLPISQFEWWIALLEVSSFFLTSGLLYIAFRKRVKISYLIFAALSFLVPVSSGTFSGLPRYILVLFPIYIALALIANKNVKTLIIIIFSILQAILFMFFARGYYIS